MAYDEVTAQALRENEKLLRAALADVPTVRDQFAMAALKGLCANPGGPFQANGLNGWGIVNCTDRDVLLICYAMADEAMAVRSADAKEDQRG